MKKKIEKEMMKLGVKPGEKDGDQNRLIEYEEPRRHLDYGIGSRLLP